jgi:hypothetical protein
MIGVSSELGDGLERIKVEGSLTAPEVRALIERFRDSAAGAQRYLVDLSQASAGDLRFPDVSALAQLSSIRQFPEAGLKVGVVAPHPAVYGVCRMFQGLRHDLADRFAVFASESECAAWMGSAEAAQA